MTIDDTKEEHLEHTELIDRALAWYRTRPWRSKIKSNEVDFILALLDDV
jgi:hypothetical protein